GPRLGPPARRGPPTVGGPCRLPPLPAVGVPVAAVASPPDHRPSRRAPRRRRGRTELCGPASFLAVRPPCLKQTEALAHVPELLLVVLPHFDRLLGPPHCLREIPGLGGGGRQGVEVAAVLPAGEVTGLPRLFHGPRPVANRRLRAGGQQPPPAIPPPRILGVHPHAPPH